MTERDRIRGCLLGGAAGDALGAPVEFLSRAAILARYGAGGIRDMDEAYGLIGAITDDTQMTLFTAEGLILRNVSREMDSFSFAWASQQRWLATQGESADPAWIGVEPGGWLRNVPQLRTRRAPGNTCLSALRVRHPYQPSADVTIRAANDSKGCGGVMRISPVGLTMPGAFDFGRVFAWQTHGHPLGWMSAGVFADFFERMGLGLELRAIVSNFVARPFPRMDVYRWEDSGQPGVPPRRIVEPPPALDPVGYGELREILGRALALADGDLPAHEAIRELGEGWVAEEALAIAVFCALRFAGDFEGGVVAAVNHDGDSDSTGAMAGQLLGCALGEGAIPARWLTALELREVVERIADDLAWAAHGKSEREPAPEGWAERYPDG